MGLTLDQLLDATGAKDLASGHTKVASNSAAGEKNTFSKLAERCRRAAEAASEEKLALDKRSLAEKTATIEIITRTIEEIAEISGGQIKVAAVQPIELERAVFIKTALEAGHSPTAIAEFLSKEGGLFDGIGRKVHEIGASLHTARAGKALGRAQQSVAHAGRKWQSLARKYENLGDADKAKFIEKLRTKLGDADAHAILSGSKGFHGMPGYKQLDSARAAATNAAKSTAAAGKDGVVVGGHQVVSGKQIQKMKGPAAMLAGGALGYRALAGGGGESDNRKKGVVVVNS